MTVVYRLACVSCDRTDYDDVSQLPDDWEDLGEAANMGSASQWWTHVGLCPECVAMPESHQVG